MPNAPRRNEILGWLEKRPRFTRYVVIDDEDDELDELPLFQPSGREGLSSEICTGVLDYLSGKTNDDMRAGLVARVVEISARHFCEIRIRRIFLTLFWKRLTIFCGECDQCKAGHYSVCERSNGSKAVADNVFGHGTASLFGYSHLTGGYPGGQAEYLRVPFADTTHIKVPDSLSDEQVLFLMPARSRTTPSRAVTASIVDLLVQPDWEGFGD